jgi:hypothetical protein
MLIVVELLITGLWKGEVGICIANTGCEERSLLDMPTLVVTMCGVLLNAPVYQSRSRGGHETEEIPHDSFCDSLHDSEMIREV